MTCLLDIDILLIKFFHCRTRHFPKISSHEFMSHRISFRKGSHNKINSYKQVIEENCISPKTCQSIHKSRIPPPSPRHLQELLEFFGITTIIKTYSLVLN